MYFIHKMKVTFMYLPFHGRSWYCSPLVLKLIAKRDRISKANGIPSTLSHVLTWDDYQHMKIISQAQTLQ
jgi:hypothetical protein